MKYIPIILLLLSQIANGQEKPQYTHIVIYRYMEPIFSTSGGLTVDGDGNVMVTSEKQWNNHIRGFTSIEAVLEWLNSGRDHWYEDHQNVKLDDSQLIGIYDIRTSKEIKVKLKTEEKVIPKHVEVQEEKWTERTYVIN